MTVIAPVVYSQARGTFEPPRIEMLTYDMRVTLTPDAHELEAAGTIGFRPLESTDIVVFEMSENLFVQRVLNSQGVELEFGQDEVGPGLLSVRFSKPLSIDDEVKITVEYRGGFDRDRYSRSYSRDEDSAYIGMEGTYLLYSAKWFPVNRFLADRATAQIEVTVPLGITVIGPGAQLPVVTKGIYETFGWSANVPILPNSIVAGQYFQRNVRVGDLKIDCYALQGKLEAMKGTAEAAGKILQYYRKAFGPSASGNSYRLVEVDDRLSIQPGMLGTIFVTQTELEQSSPDLSQLARRIAYQWWQDTVGVSRPEDLWLVDGMAYYSAAQCIGSIEGPAALKAELDKLAVLALKFENRGAIREGVGLGYRTDKYESVVAGKGAWVINMLRGIVGDSKFNQLVSQYVKQGARKGGSAAVFRKIAEGVYGKPLDWFFAEWIDTIGVPTLETDYVVFKTQTGFRVSGAVTQDRDLFRMPVEVGVLTSSEKKGDERKVTVELNGKSTSFDVSTSSMPTQVLLDPDNRLLRDSKELQTSVKLSLGDDLRKKADYVEAVRNYEEAIKLSPHSSLAHFRLAEIFYEQFNLQSAANTFRDALNGDRDPKWIEVWCYIYLGKIYDILGQRQRAMAEYNKALNTKDDTDGAQTEAKKWLNAPFTRARTIMGSE